MKWDGTEVDVSDFDEDDPRVAETKTECPLCFPTMVPGQDTICRPSEPDPGCSLCGGYGLVTKEVASAHLKSTGALP